MRPFPRKKKLCKVKTKKRKGLFERGATFRDLCNDRHSWMTVHPRWSASLGNKAPTSRRASHQSAAVVTRSPLVRELHPQHNNYSHDLTNLVGNVYRSDAQGPEPYVVLGKKSSKKKLWNAQLHKIIASCRRPPHPAQMSRAVTPRTPPTWAEIGFS